MKRANAAVESPYSSSVAHEKKHEMSDRGTVSSLRDHRQVFHCVAYTMKQSLQKYGGLFLLTHNESCVKDIDVTL